VQQAQPSEEPQVRNIGSVRKRPAGNATRTLDSVGTLSSCICKVSTMTCGLGYDNVFTWAVVVEAPDLLEFLATKSG
jgi:hypothetical protein